MKKLIFLLALILMFFPLCAAGKLVFSNEAKNLMTKNEAQDYCYDLKEKGASDWRLPTTAELSGLNKIEGYYWASDREKIKKKYVNDEDKSWFYDFSTKKREKSFVSTKMYVVCVRNEVAAKPKPAQKLTPPVEKKTEPPTQKIDPKDKNACEFSRNNSQNSMDAWEFYLKKFPNGVCAGEARTAIEKYNKQKRAEKERTLYEKAKKENTLSAWEKYLNEIPDGEHSFEAELNIEIKKKEYLKGRKIGNLVWSDLSSKEMAWNDAKQYCENLSEGGFTDWRLPNIDELRTLLIADRVSSGCKVSERNNCLSLESCWSCSTCTQTGIEDLNSKYKKCSDWGKTYTDGRYSRLGDGKVWLWSSSTLSDHSGSAWNVIFDCGNVNFNAKDHNYYVRCVR
jgi:outer membrane lipoprotein-sorting protein